jgi:hypothetical protein
MSPGLRYSARSVSLCNRFEREIDDRTTAFSQWWNWEH